MRVRVEFVDLPGPRVELREAPDRGCSGCSGSGLMWVPDGPESMYQVGCVCSDRLLLLASFPVPRWLMVRVLRRRSGFDLF